MTSTAMLLAAAGCRTGPARASVDRASEQAGLTFAAGGAGARPGVTLRRLSASDDYDGFFASAVSPDGNYISFIDWSNENWAVRDLRTGKVHPLTTEGAYEGEPYSGADGVSLFSPDGRRILYGWRHGSVLQLRVMDFKPGETGVAARGTSTILFENPRFEPYFPFDWSPDGSQILAEVYLLPNGAGTQLALISTTDRTYRALKTFTWGDPKRAAFSPDGRYVAYDALPAVDSPNRDIFVVSLDGTYEARIVEGPAADRLLGWQQDGSILFHSDHGGTPGIWRLPMRDGRPAGQAELVKAEMWKVKPLGFSGDRFYYGVTVDLGGGLYTVDVDLATGNRTGTPVAIGNTAWDWDWSPDGKSIAFADSSSIHIRNDGGVYSFPFDLSGRYGSLRWHPDGKSLIVFARDAKGRDGFHRVDLQTGSHTTIVRSDQLENPVRDPGNFDVSADGRTLWFVTVDYRYPPWHFDLVAYDLQTGNVQPIDLKSVHLAEARVSVSPDGSRLAIVAADSSGNRQIGTIPVKGGPFTPLASIEDTKILGSIEWAPDGGALVFLATSHESWPGGSRAWSVPSNGGEVRPLETLGASSLKMEGRLKVHPLRGRIAYRAGGSREEVWVMEGLGRSAASSATGGSQ